MSSTPPEATGPEGTSTEAEVTVRRAPKVPVFLILGALLGFFVTLILTSLFPTDPTVGFPATFGYFLLYGVPAGVVLGALVALLLDRISVRRAKRVTVEHTTVDPLPYED
jgi:F0F1-type ATP synthase assembly protein I